jgi:hypothetical protein
MPETLLYKTLAFPVLCYGSEAWTMKKKDEGRKTACEMRFMRATKWDLKRNEDVMKRLHVEPMLDYIQC